MYIPSQRLHEPPGTATGRAIRTQARGARRALSTRQAAALYVIGILVEALGLGLIASYGWFVAGTAIAAAGVCLATAGNRAWPAPEGSATATRGISGYLAARIPRI